jgi:hypothetical protein
MRSTRTHNDFERIRRETAKGVTLQKPSVTATLEGAIQYVLAGGSHYKTIVNHLSEPDPFRPSCEFQKRLAHANTGTHCGRRVERWKVRSTRDNSAPVVPYNDTTEVNISSFHVRGIAIESTNHD